MKFLEKLESKKRHKVKVDFWYQTLKEVEKINLENVDTLIVSAIGFDSKKNPIIQKIKEGEIKVPEYLKKLVDKVENLKKEIIFVDLSPEHPINIFFEEIIKKVTLQTKRFFDDFAKDDFDLIKEINQAKKYNKLYRWLKKAKERIIAKKILKEINQKEDKKFFILLDPGSFYLQEYLSKKFYFEPNLAPKQSLTKFQEVISQTKPKAFEILKTFVEGAIFYFLKDKLQEKFEENPSQTINQIKNIVDSLNKEEIKSFLINLSQNESFESKRNYIVEFLKSINQNLFENEN